MQLVSLEILALFAYGLIRLLQGSVSEGVKVEKQ